MLFGKKKKISEYLLVKQKTQIVTAFDDLLLDYLSGTLKDKLVNLEMKHIDIHIDWLPDYKCIDIQGKVKEYYFDIQIEPESFSIAYDKDEPEDVMEYDLTSKNEFYKKIECEISGID